MRFLHLAAVLGTLALASAQAAADCACLCVDGTLKTICTAPDEVRANLGICGERANQGCPVSAEPLAPESYDPPDGAQNCRKVQVYDAKSDGYLAAKVCDVAPATAEPAG